MGELLQRGVVGDSDVPDDLLAVLSLRLRHALGKLGPEAATLFLLRCADSGDTPGNEARFSVDSSSSLGRLLEGLKVHYAPNAATENGGITSATRGCAFVGGREGRH